MAGGRPTKYKVDYARQAEVACREGGFTDVKLAKLFSVTVPTITGWKKSHPGFFTSIKKGKDDYDVMLAEDCLMKRLQGYNYIETTKKPNRGKGVDPGTLVITKQVTKHVVPDTTAQIFFLKNRQPERWRDRQQIDVGITKELAAHALKLAEARGRKVK